ncbi:hypothetical protein BDV11DRAFT_8064 [Aspergillus similis]
MTCIGRAYSFFTICVYSLFMHFFLFIPASFFHFSFFFPSFFLFSHWLYTLGIDSWLNTSSSSHCISRLELLHLSYSGSASPNHVGCFLQSNPAKNVRHCKFSPHTSIEASTPLHSLSRAMFE